MTSKVVFITGISRGIGKQIALQCLNEGYRVIGTYNNSKDFESLDSDFSKFTEKNLIVKHLDVRNPAAIKKLREDIEQAVDKIDILVNNAGIMDENPGEIDKQNLEDWDNTLNINLRGPFLVSQELLGLLKKSSKATILNISGGLGTFSSGMTGGTHCAYRVSKAGLNALTLILSEELKSFGISVLAIDPGWVKTDLGGSDAPKSAEKAASEVLKTIAGTQELKTGSLIKEMNVVGW